MGVFDIKGVIWSELPDGDLLLEGWSSGVVCGDRDDYVGYRLKRSCADGSRVQGKVIANILQLLEVETVGCVLVACYERSRVTAVIRTNYSVIGLAYILA